MLLRSLGTASSSLLQQSQLRTILKNANVPQNTADQITQQDSQNYLYLGYVRMIETVDEGTYAHITGEEQFAGLGAGDFVVTFPPNDPKHLAELVRAMNYPHLRVKCGVYCKSPTDPGTIFYLGVFTDYIEPSLPGQPPFDVREIVNAT